MMRGHILFVPLALGILVAIPARAEQNSAGLVAVGSLARGTALFRNGDLAGAVAQWSEAIRVAHAAGAALIEAQALGRRGEAYRVRGHIREAAEDLRAALAIAGKGG